MTIHFYDLVGKNSHVRFSPHCWKVRLSLLAKKLNFVGVDVSYTQKELIEFSGQTLLPVLKNGENIISDSWEIIHHLEAHYPEIPLFTVGEAKAKSFHNWCNTELVPHIRPMVLLKIHNALLPEDQRYFRSTREKSLGMSLEIYCADEQQHIQGLLKTLKTVNTTLENQRFLGGDSINFDDISLMGMLMWIANIRSISFLNEVPALYEWFTQMNQEFPEITAYLYPSK